ncbi:HET-domain-containing protein [Macroventuria anomochaeta]|uniref:HET-domain-containing protein n=1 Tax=Macroventuria anomochaeta TaxID=301207 RepID=A0ACB6RJ12_9PLEO|nr:HET-domain-containing protein [Macroventuria anomochaeta]KAF2621900.1 HET-domain-containing protein [Macroventuria anomochaeta]
MFPWADGDSLRDYWDNTRWQCPTGDIISQAVTQLRGLADALVSLHDGVRARASRNDENDTDEDEDSINLNIQIRNEDNEVTKPLETPNPKNIRHGDLKPENILRFVGTGISLGTLKIADMGLAKQHIVATQDRKHLTSTRYGTIRYEAPEAVDTLQGPRSRLYDIWSMGCITLEFIIWILYGNDELNNFYTQVQGGDKQRLCQYFEMLDVGQARRAEVHPVVLRWISHIEKVDPECQRDSATRDLIRLVREKLLVVPLPPNRASAIAGGRGFAAPELGQITTRYRATAVEFRDALDEIIAKISNKEYLLVGGDRDHIKPPRLRPSMPSTSTSTTQSRDRTDLPRLGSLQLRPPIGVLTEMPGVPIRPADYTLPPMKDWEFNVDNLFAESVLLEVGSEAMVPSTRVRTKLCSRCKALNFWASSFKLEDELSALHLRAKTCDFCGLVAMACKHNEVIKNDKLQIERKQSNLMLTGDPYPVLSIIRSPEAKPPLHIQLGFPELPNPQSDTFFSIVKLWLRNCNTDQDHSECRAKNRGLLPTRLIDVGTPTHPQLRVIETDQERPISGEYIALSHPWGDTRMYEPFSTLRKDDSGRQHDIEHFKKAIPYTELPATFRDAVDCTRRLEVRYLWIDSICIIQGLDGDFNEEAKKMEDVFSGAYCVLAASRASSQLDGFLGTRPQRQYVAFQRGTEKPFYVCRTIDNFSKDVIEGSLNKRGWVLQERALARRTVYFTETQTYFECGKGVRCETLTTMKNNMADFLGDPNFPDKAMRTTSRALKISWFQELYKQYSRLDFTRYEDRPLAIAGLEKRLQEAFGIKGGYGIFDDGNKANGGLFHRSLLWQRGEEESDEQCLIPIDFPAEREISVPSWSWMAYKGGISYADPPFESAIWERDDIVPSWTGGTTENSTSLASGGGPELMATVRDFNTAGYKSGDIKLTYDTERTRGVDGQRARCVIIARSDDGRAPGEKRFYVLLVTAAEVRPDYEEEIYSRAGAGYMLGKYIALDKPGTQARIV